MDYTRGQRYRITTAKWHLREFDRYLLFLVVCSIAERNIVDFIDPLCNQIEWPNTVNIVWGRLRLKRRKKVSSLRDLMLKPAGPWMDPYFHLSIHCILIVFYCGGRGDRTAAKHLLERSGPSGHFQRHVRGSHLKWSLPSHYCFDAFMQRGVSVKTIDISLNF